MSADARTEDGEPIFTVGHSDRSLEEFLDLLRKSAIDRVVDVRRLAGSSKYPHFDEDALRGSLGEACIELVRVQALTGRRPVSRTVPFSKNAWWQNRSFHNYADHAMSEEFHDGLAEVRAWAREQRLALMCAEAVWWRCHRRIIADHLIAHGEPVHHIMGPGRTVEAVMSDGAVVGGDHGVTYPG